MKRRVLKGEIWQGEGAYGETPMKGEMEERRASPTCVEDHGALLASRQKLKIAEKSFSRELHVEVGQGKSRRP